MQHMSPAVFIYLDGSLKTDYFGLISTILAEGSLLIIYVQKNMAPPTSCSIKTYQFTQVKIHIKGI